MLNNYGEEEDFDMSGLIYILHKYVFMCLLFLLLECKNFFRNTELVILSLSFFSILFIEYFVFYWKKTY